MTYPSAIAGHLTASAMADLATTNSPSTRSTARKPGCSWPRGDDGGLREMQRRAAARERRRAGPRAAQPQRRRRRDQRWRYVAGCRRVGGLAAASRSCCSWSPRRSSRRRSPSAADNELGGAGFPLTSPNTILVLGSDARPKGTQRGRARRRSASRRARTRSCCMRIGGGHNATLSIPRDTVVEHPRPRPEQDQRRLRDRRPRARDPHGRAVPRHPGQPPRRGQLRELPAADRRARRRHLQGRLRRSPSSTAAARTAATRCA